MANEIKFLNFIKNQPSPCFYGLVPERIIGSLDTLGPFNAEQINFDSFSANYYVTNVYANKQLSTSPFPSVEKPSDFYWAKLTAAEIANALGTVGNSGYLIRILSEMAYGYYVKVTYFSDHSSESQPYYGLRFERGYVDNRDPSNPVETRIGSMTTATMFINYGACVYLGGGFSVFGEFEVNNVTHKGLVIDLNAVVCSPTSSSGHTYPEASEDNALKATGQWRRYNSSVAYWNSLLPDGAVESNPFYFETAINEYKFWLDGNGTFATYELSPEAGEPSGEDGYYGGSFDDSSDSIPIPTTPLIGVTNVGMVNVYKVPDGGLRRFGLELFPEFSFTPPGGTGDALTDLYELIKDFVSDTADMLSNTQASTLINYVIDCHVIPVTPTYTTSEFVKVGGRVMSTVAANPVTQDYVDFSCGELNISEYYANFADYLTTAKLYLPFVGFVPVRAEWFQSSHLSVDYRFNVIDGSFVAFVRGYGEKVNNNQSTGTVLAQYTGNACVHIPITGANYAQMVSGVIGAAGGIATGAATGNFVAAAGSALSLIGLHGDIAQSNAYGASPAFMGVRVPFLLIERPVSNFSVNYPHENGIPCNITSTIGTASGFVTATELHLDGIPCTDEERRLIEAAFTTGVIV